MVDDKAVVHVLPTFDAEEKEHMDFNKKVRRVVGVLESKDLPATFFLDAHTTRIFPKGIKLLKEKGYELALHSDYHFGVSNSHSPTLDFSVQDSETQISRFQNAIAMIREVVPDFDPKGFRAPGLRWNEDLYVSLKKLGFLYDGSQKLECFQPFLMNDILVFPFNSKEFDTACYQLTLHGVLNRWVKSFNDACKAAADIGESYFILLMHPTCVGKELFTPLLETILSHIVSRSDVDVEFQTCREATKVYLQKTGLPDRKVLVLDTSAIIGGFVPRSNLQKFTVPEVLKESKDYQSKLKIEGILETKGIVIRSPSENSQKILDTHYERGKSGKVSVIDMKLLALALDLKDEGMVPAIVAEDYHDHRIQKMTERIGIVYQQIIMKNLFKKTEWSSVCPACGKAYQAVDPFEAFCRGIKCSICDTKLMRLPKKTYWTK